MSADNPIPQKFSLLKNDGTNFVPDPTKTYKVDFNGNITVWDGVISTLAATDLLLPGNDVYTPDVRFRWQMMARNATILNNRSTQDVDIIDFTQFSFSLGTEATDVIQVTITLNDINNSAKVAPAPQQNLRIVMSTSVTNPFAGAQTNLVSMTPSTGAIVSSSGPFDQVVVSANYQVVMDVTGPAGVSSSSGNFLHVLKSSSDTTGITVKRGVSPDIVFA